jgi:hypothetical protein
MNGSNIEQSECNGNPLLKRPISGCSDLYEGQEITFLAIPTVVFASRFLWKNPFLPATYVLKYV